MFERSRWATHVEFWHKVPYDQALLQFDTKFQACKDSGLDEYDSEQEGVLPVPKGFRDDVSIAGEERRRGKHEYTHQPDTSNLSLVVGDIGDPSPQPQNNPNRQVRDSCLITLPRFDTIHLFSHISRTSNIKLLSQSESLEKQYNM